MCNALKQWINEITKEYVYTVSMLVPFINICMIYKLF